MMDPYARTLARQGKQSGNWKLAGSWTYASNVTEVDFTDVGGYSDLLVIMRGVSTDAAQNRWLRFSVDNGSSFYSASGDYQSVAATGVESAVTGLSGLSGTTTAAATSTWAVFASNVSGVPKAVKVLNQAERLFTGSTSPINAVRLFPSGGAVFTAGNIYVLGRVA